MSNRVLGFSGCGTEKIPDKCIFHSILQRIHHMGHHQAYTDKLNAGMDKLKSMDPDLASKGIDHILQNLDKVPDEGVKKTLRNHGGGYVNHTVFWNNMGPNCGGPPTGKVGDAIKQTFGSFDQFKEKFNNAAATHFGSGWAWLYVDKNEQPPQLKVESYPNQDTPAMEKGKVPILGLDVWEHAYYLKYQNKKAAYIEAWWNVVNWNDVNKRYDEAMQ
eukprot:gb/GECG01015836.1/.p1 GENE.gb/GECG01015836.1/~~gb/GECG01015836.1/.p1  ORF type:complete len:217 (+),score=26.65 gb/GECG01015836.1/:1-651(+)